MLDVIGTIFGIFMGTGIMTIITLGGLLAILAFTVKGLVKLIKWLFK